MKNILIVNGHEPFPFAAGKLNQTLFDEMIRVLSEKYDIKSTVVNDGYNVEDEIKKFQWADVVILQHPIYWFGLPGLFKSYIDRVYQYGIFFAGSEKYGDGGLMREKKYMLSTTWNAPLKAFNDKEQFFEGKNVDEALFSIHKLHQFCGLTPLKSFSCHDVVQHPDIESYLKNLRVHLEEVFEL